MKKVLTFGVFDYFHLGHLRLFKQAKQYGDYLIVAVQRDECVAEDKPGAVLRYSLDERIELIESIKIVDDVLPYDHISPLFLDHMDFDILALGEDHCSA